eukprot:3002486-Pyramimonas_sp.AAC.1
MRDECFRWNKKERDDGREHTQLQNLTALMFGTARAELNLHRSETNSCLLFCHTYLGKKMGPASAKQENGLAGSMNW